jgi:hypothetical protein
LLSTNPKFTSKQRLGKVTAIYRDRGLTWRDFILTFLPAIVAVMTPIIYGTVREQYAENHFGPAAANTWSWSWYTLSAFALIPLLWLAVLRVRSAHRVIKVFTNAIYIQSTGGKRYLLGWNNISGLVDVKIQYTFIGIPLRRKHCAIIYHRKGKPIQLDYQIRDLDELCARIKAKIYPKLLPEYRSILKSGENLEFGQFTINRNTLAMQGKEFSWNRISQISPQTGFLVVEIENQNQIKYPMEKIPNIELLIQLIQEGVVA